jgi:hypothetical protein
MPIDILRKIIAEPWFAIILILYAIGLVIKIKLKEILEFITGKLEDKIKILEFEPQVEWLGAHTPPLRLTTRLAFSSKSPFRFKIDYINLDLSLVEIHIRNYRYDRDRDSKVPEGLNFSEIMEGYADSWRIETTDRFTKGIIEDLSEPPSIYLKGEVVFSTIRGHRKVPMLIDKSKNIDRKKWEEIKSKYKPLSAVT